ncbi:MAG: hypothetical protein NZO58_14065, partial [Gemmataceae bacterium]|nr:hypothetical protein [Gemmataceae bacterium]
MAFYAGRDDFRTYRSKEIAALLTALERQPRAVVLFAHRNSLETLRRCLPSHLRMIETRRLGLCAMALIARVSG